MQEFNYIPVNGHVVASIRGRQFLVEPGIPYSIADRPLLLDGKRIGVEREVSGLSAKSLSPQVGIELDGVLGANVCKEFVVNILPENHIVELDQYLKDFPINIEVDNMGGVAMMHMSIAGRRMRGLLDLGSRLSMIHPDLVEGYQPIARESEIFSFCGEREVEVYSLPVMIDQRPVHLRFGVMPPEVAEWLELANVQASLGSELLDHFAVSLAMEEGAVALDPLH